MLISVLATSHAQVVRDGSIGPRNPMNPQNGPHYQIPANLGEARGSNLFHSFRQFDLQIGDAATFTGDGARNILARVTGGTESSINGRINADTNLFLMNRAGIVFHENASISVNGSFFATTADFIRMEDGGRFGATLADGDKVLTSADPSAFGFLTANPKAIVVRSTAFTDSGLKTLGLIGGDVTVDAGVNIQAEDVQIHSVRAAGEASFRLPTDTNGLRYPAIDIENFAQHGAVTVGRPVAPGNPLPPSASITASRVVIRGGTLVMAGAQVIAVPAAPGDGVSLHLTNTLSLERTNMFVLPSGDLLDAPAVDIVAGEASIKASQVGVFTDFPAGGGDIRLSINGALRVADSSTIFSQASFARGGIIIAAATSVEVVGNSLLVTRSDVLGQSGNIILSAAKMISLTGGGSVRLNPEVARGERLAVSAEDLLISGYLSGIYFNDTSEIGVGGSIDVDVRGKLTVLDAGLISALTFGRDGAAINIRANNALISGVGVSADRDTGITSGSVSGLGGKGGRVELNINGTLDVLDGGVISTNTLGAGEGGNIRISAHDMTVTGRGNDFPGLSDLPRGITALNQSGNPAEISGPSGNIQLLLSGKLEVRNAGEIAVDTFGSGAGGSIDIAARDLHLATKGTIAARTKADINGGQGGDVMLDISNRLQVDAGGLVSAGTLGAGSGGTVEIRGNGVSVSGTNAQISAVSGGPEDPATGHGGDVRLHANNLRISNDGQITASTFGSGAGGSVQIETKTLQIDDDDRATFAGISAQTLASGAGGDGGQVQIDARVLTMRGDGAAISTQSFGGGSSGRIEIAAGTITMRDDSSIQSSSVGLGAAGSIRIGADGDITLLSGSSLSVASAQSDAGDIQVKSNSSINLTDSSVTAQAAVNGGSIDLRARDLLFLTDSQITAAAGLNGGNIFIDPVFVVLDRSLISANAILGRGGNIRIISDFFIASPDSLVTATSVLGIDGTVRHRRPKHRLDGQPGGIALHAAQRRIAAAGTLLRKGR